MLDQALNIAGSLVQVSNLNLADEGNMLGVPLTGQAGSTASITTVSGSDVTITGLTGMTVADVTNWLTISGAASGSNNGTFLIDSYISPTSVTVVNPAAVAGDANNGAISWIERYDYTLLADLNYARTDRARIKGVGYDAAIPTYQQPNAIGTFLPADLSHIATKTTDAVAYIINAAYFGEAVATGNTLVTVSSAGNLKHADSVNRLGIPVFDTGPFAGDPNACYVHITDGYSSGGELSVLTGPHAGERIFGFTFNGSSTSPNSVEVHFYSSPWNLNYALNYTPYTWEAGQPDVINLLYGYNERLDAMDENAFREVPALGILTDAALVNDINNILDTIGTISSDQNLNGLLTNTGSYFPFYNLPNATPTVVDALNTLNTQIGNRTYTGGLLTSGQTITASLQVLANSISNSTVTRTIEVLSANLPAGTAHTLPGSISYTLDGTGNGQYLWVYVRGVIQHPGAASAFADYTETNTTSITFYKANKKGDYIDYFVK
jgi:hypothetical protein